MRVTLSWLFGKLISHGRLTLSLAKAVITVTLPAPPAKKEEKGNGTLNGFMLPGTMRENGNTVLSFYPRLGSCHFLGQPGVSFCTQ